MNRYGTPAPGYPLRMLASIFGVIAVVVLAYGLSLMNTAGWALTAGASAAFWLAGILAALSSGAFLLHRFFYRK